MTTDVNLDQLQLREKELDTSIERAESDLEDMKSERKKIKGRIFQIISSQNVSITHRNPPKPIRDRKNSF